MTAEEPREARYLPRKMDVDRLVDVLVDEHKVMREGMQRAKEAAEAEDFDGVGRALRDIDPVFRQHIADEESQILKLLIARLGVKGAESEISVFRQHRPIHDLMTKIGELAALSSAGLEARQSELAGLFEEHTRLEETRVFPRTLSLREKGGKGA